MSDYTMYLAKQRANEVPFDHKRFNDLYEAAMADPDPDGDIRLGKIPSDDHTKLINSIVDIVDEYVQDKTEAVHATDIAYKEEIRNLRAQMEIMESTLKEIAYGKYIPTWGQSARDSLTDAIRAANHALYESDDVTS